MAIESYALRTADKEQIRLGPLHSVAALSASRTVHTQPARQPNDQLFE